MKNQDYCRKTLPYLKEEYFSDSIEKIVFSQIRDYIVRYNKQPTLETIVIDTEDQQEISNDEKKNVEKLVKSLEDQEPVDDEAWLYDVSEKFCQDQAIYNALVNAISIADGKNKDGLSKGAIPQLLTDALGVTFNPNVGHDFIEDWDDRYDYYHADESRTPFDIEILNKITKGGIPDKTLNVILGGVNMGKTACLCSMAAMYLALGYDVLYITLEMAEQEIAKRIDANLLDISLDDIHTIPRETYEKRINRLKTKTNGKLIVKEYPSASANVLHFESLLNELWLKRRFKPKVVLVDYINEMTSSRVKMGNSVNSYFFIKSIASELRGMAVKHGFFIWTATQLTRSGFKNSDADMTDVAESFGLPAVADFLLLIMSNEEMEKLGQYICKQLKNRYNSKITNRSFTIGIDYSHMRLHDVTQDHAQAIADAQPKATAEGVNKFSGLKV